jgi:GH25 family lysozyme M1 (1,4-beta-N-acetylmuramidase)
MTIFYPDVSDYQAGISFGGCVIAMVKATENDNYINPDYAPAKVRAAHAGAYFCAYHFLHAGNGAGQAAYAYRVVGGEVPLMVDFEPTYNSDGTIASAPQVSDAVAFINEYRALGGKTYLLYLPHWYWAGNLGQTSLAPLIDLGMLLVSSDYTAYSDTGPGWTPYGGMTPVVWQYTSTATLNGVSNVDFNAYKNTLADFQAQATTGAMGRAQRQSWPSAVSGAERAGGRLGQPGRQVGRGDRRRQGRGELHRRGGRPERRGVRPRNPDDQFCCPVRPRSRLELQHPGLGQRRPGATSARGHQGDGLIQVNE